MKSLKALASDSDVNIFSPSCNISSEHLRMKYVSIFGSYRYIPVNYYTTDNPRLKLYGWIYYCSDCSISLYASDPRDVAFGYEHYVHIDGTPVDTDPSIGPRVIRWTLIPKPKRRRPIKKKRVKTHYESS